MDVVRLALSSPDDLPGPPHPPGAVIRVALHLSTSAPPFPPRLLLLLRSSPYGLLALEHACKPDSAFRARVRAELARGGGPLLSSPCWSADVRAAVALEAPPARLVPSLLASCPHAADYLLAAAACSPHLAGPYARASSSPAFLSSLSHLLPTPTLSSPPPPLPPQPPPLPPPPRTRPHALPPPPPSTPAAALRLLSRRRCRRRHHDFARLPSPRELVGVLLARPEPSEAESEAAVDAWWRLHTGPSDSPELLTAAALSPKASVETPLALLTDCPDEALSRGPALHVLLASLEGLLAASRRRFPEALALAQESAAVQLLLELCVSRPEARAHVFPLVHRLFVERAGLARLVHEQGYPASLAGALLAGVPSAHTCLEFLPDMLGAGGPARQLFAAVVLSHAAERWPVPAALDLCRGVLARLSRPGVAAAVPPDAAAELAPALARMARAFAPALDADAGVVLARMARRNRR